MGISQWALGCYERYLEGEGEVWLDAARQAGDYLVAEQSADGGWYEEHAHPHTFVVRAPWLSAMAQGQCVSVLVRLFLESGEARFAESAAQRMRPLAKPFAEGGVRSYLAGSPILEEYPTDPPSHVLNGAIFALWGYYDAWRGLEDAEAGEDSGIASTPSRKTVIAGIPGRGLGTTSTLIRASTWQVRSTTRFTSINSEPRIPSFRLRKSPPSPPPSKRTLPVVVTGSRQSLGKSLSG